MWLGRVRITIGVLAAVTAVVGAGEAVRSSGGAAAPTHVAPLALPTPSSAATRGSPSSAVPGQQKVDVGYLRAQWVDAESQIRAAGAAAGQQAQQAATARNGPAITAALNQEVAAVSAQDQRIAALPWPSRIRPHIDAFESTSAAALNQLRAAASNPFGYDANQVNAAIVAFNAAANVVRHDLGLPSD